MACSRAKFTLFFTLPSTVFLFVCDKLMAVLDVLQHFFVRNSLERFVDSVIKGDCSY
jgi:hypothetical protein